MGGAAGSISSAVRDSAQPSAAESAGAYTPPATSTEAAPYQPAITTLQGFEGYRNPFRSAPGAGNNTSPYLQIPGAEGVRNPFYSPYQAQQVKPGPSAEDLAQQYQSYTQGYKTNLDAAQAQRVADAQAAQQAYETARGNAALRAEYEAKLAEQQRQLEAAQQQQNSYSDGNYNWGASGGDVGIAGLRRRKP